MELFNPISLVFGTLWLLGLLVSLALTVFWIWALIDCLLREFADPIIKLMWVVIIIFAHFLGAVLYWVIGRSRGVRR